MRPRRRIKINWLRTIRQLDSTNIEVEVMALDAEGKPVPTGQLKPRSGFPHSGLGRRSTLACWRASRGAD